MELLTKQVQLFGEDRYEEAMPYAVKAIDAAKKEFGDTSFYYANSLNNLAALYERIGKYAPAESFYIRASSIYKKVLAEVHPAYHTYLYVGNLRGLAFLYVSMGNYAAAEPLYIRALSVSKKVLGRGEEYAAASSGLGMLYTATGNYAAAEPLFKQALAGWQKETGEDDPILATTLNNLAALYERMSRYAAAEPLYLRASAIIKKKLGETHPNYASAINNLAGLYVSMGNYASAELLFRQALALRKAVFGDNHLMYAQSLNNLATLYAHMGNYKAAEPLYTQALKIYKDVLGEKNADYISILSNLADLHTMLGNYAGAERLSKQALAIRKNILGEQHPDYAISLTNLAYLYQSAGRYALAKPLYTKALAVYKKASGNDDPGYAAALNNLAFLYESMNNYAEAAKYFTLGTHIKFTHVEKNFDILSEAEKLKWWENEKGNFQAAPSLLFTYPKPSVSFLQQSCSQQLQLKGFVLNNGARVLKEARQEGNGQLRLLLDRWQNHKATLAKQYSLPAAARVKRLDSLEKVTNDLEKQINLQSATFRASRENYHIGFNEVQQQLKQDEAAVEFIRFQYFRKRWTDSVFYAAFIILPKDTLPHFITLCEEDQLAGLLESRANSSEQFVQQLYRGIDIINNNLGNNKKGDSLYSLVWKPLLPWLKGIKKISIAPAGLLNRVAFNALPLDSSHYLIDKYQLRQYSSVRQIAEKKMPASGNTPDAVLFGGIAFDRSESNVIVDNGGAGLPDAVKRSIHGGTWAPLPGTLQEVRSIHKLFKNSKRSAQVITGTAATEESFKQLSGHSPKILHLATHGFSLPDAEQKRKGNISANDNAFTLADDPLMRSGIILAGANRVWGGALPLAGKEDGIVTAYEISNLDLSNTDLVVLSACETALGDIRGTEGVFGLQRAFKLAGVQNMLLSLWQVPDKETAELMTLLYTNKLKGLSNYEAFNRAQDVMRKKYPPYYWAAFVLME